MLANCIQFLRFMLFRWGEYPSPNSDVLNFPAIKKKRINFFIKLKTISAYSSSVSTVISLAVMSWGNIHCAMGAISLARIWLTSCEPVR